MLKFGGGMPDILRVNTRPCSTKTGLFLAQNLL